MLIKTDREILDFEAERFKYAGAKDSLIRERWGISSTTYYARLGHLLEDDEALAYAPMLVRRLRRLRDARRQVRVRSRA